MGGRVWNNSSNRLARMGVGLILCAALGVQCQNPQRLGSVSPQGLTVEVIPMAAVVSNVRDANEERARADALGFLYYCRQQYDQHVRDYRCTFTKQERIGDRITAEQVTDVRCRESPFSVDMIWTRNAEMAGRALYVAGRWLDAEGNELAWVRPAGALARLLKLRQPIHGVLAQKSARRTIDQFGFRNSLELIIHYSEQAQRGGALNLAFVGRGHVEGRPTYVFERRLPYSGDETVYPDRLLVFHIDQEWLVPTACFSYADDDGTEVLGRYITTDVQLNPGYTDRDFDPEVINF